MSFLQFPLIKNTARYKNFIEDIDYQAQLNNSSNNLYSNMYDSFSYPSQYGMNMF